MDTSIAGLDGLACAQEAVMHIAAVGMPGMWELLLILAIVLIFFGVGKLPNVLKSMGQGVREFRKASTGEGDDDDKPKPGGKGEVEKNL